MKVREYPGEKMRDFTGAGSKNKSLSRTKFSSCTVLECTCTVFTAGLGIGSFALSFFAVLLKTAQITVKSDSERFTLKNVFDRFPPLFIPSANHYQRSSLSRSFFKSDHERMAQFALNKEQCERFAKKTVKCTFALSLTKTSDSPNKTMCEFPTLIHWDNISLNWMCLFLYIITRILYPKTEG